MTVILCGDGRASLRLDKFGRTTEYALSRMLLKSHVSPGVCAGAKTAAADPSIQEKNACAFRRITEAFMDVTAFDTVEVVVWKDSAIIRVFLDFKRGAGARVADETRHVGAVLAVDDLPSRFPTPRIIFGSECQGEGA
jgi:hypothetical protein